LSRRRRDDWVKTCGEPTVWTGFDWPEIVEATVVLPHPSVDLGRHAADVILGLKAEVELWKDRCEALQRDFEATLEASCPNCGQTY
jgi:hypothetical protein